MRRVVPLVFLMLSGCMLDQKPNNAPVIDTGKAIEHAVLEGNSKIESTIKTSADQYNQNAAAVGAQIERMHTQIEASGIKIQKLSDNLEVTGAKIDRMETRIQAEVKIDPKLESDIALLRNSNVELARQVELTGVKFHDLEAKGQAAWNANMEETKKELNAQRDAVDNSVQFTKDMAATLERSYAALESAQRWQYWTTLAFCGVIVKLVLILGHTSRSRAETRYSNEVRERQHWQQMIVKLLDRNGDGKLTDAEIGGAHAHGTTQGEHRRSLLGRLFSWLR